MNATDHGARLDPLLTPDLLHALASAGHGDRVVIVDGALNQSAPYARISDRRRPTLSVSHRNLDRLPPLPQ
jgi:L-fucose mutarotase/ribose pyranase (RbsD/FucU family)